MIGLSMVTEFSTGPLVMVAFSFSTIDGPLLARIGADLGRRAEVV